jgi:hypothetical protein
VIQRRRKMLQTALLRRKVTIHRRKVKTAPHEEDGAAGDGRRGLEPAGADGPLQEGEPPPEEAVGGEGDHAEGVAGFEFEDAGDELGDSAVGEGEGDDGGDGLVGEDAGVDQAKEDGGEAEAGEAEGAGVGEFGKW